MQKRGLTELIGATITHKTLGVCEIIEVVSIEDGKFIGKIQSTGEVKKLIFSNQFFTDVDDFETVNVSVQKKPGTKRIRRKVDLDKYRNHPLVKEIEKQENKSKSKDEDYEDLIS